MKTKISMPLARKRLAIVWFTFGGFLFLLLFFQTIFGHYGEKVNEAWSWFLPTIFPTLSLITTIFVSEANQNKAYTGFVNGFLYSLTMGLSILYLFVVSLVFFISPFTNSSPIELMNLSNFGLGPMQGIVIACMGIFFIKKKSD